MKISVSRSKVVVLKEQLYIFWVNINISLLIIYVMLCREYMSAEAVTGGGEYDTWIIWVEFDTRCFVYHVSVLSLLSDRAQPSCIQVFRQRATKYLRIGSSWGTANCGNTSLIEHESGGLWYFVTWPWDTTSGSSTLNWSSVVSSLRLVTIVYMNMIREYRILADTSAHTSSCNIGSSPHRILAVPPLHGVCFVCSHCELPPKNI